jgi:hypothetical protein
MAVPIDQWLQAIKDRRGLDVCPTPRLKASRWGPVFDRAIDTFNDLSTAHRLGVTLHKSDKLPDTEGLKDGGADVQFDFTGTGTPRYRFRSQDLTADTQISGTGLEGLTEMLSTGGRAIKAYIFVPMFPLADFNREVGDQIKLFIAVHELIHAAGCLSNDDHSPEGDPDVMCGPPKSTPSFSKGNTGPPDNRDDATKDKLHLKPGTQTPTRFIPGVTAPPLKLSARTVRLIQKRWT